MRRSVFLGAVLTLTLVTAIAMIATAAVMQTPPLTSPAPGDVDTARRFYAAVNSVIATGDPTLLHAVVAPHFVAQAPLPGEGAGRRGLEAYLATLHDVDPALRLEPSVVAAAGVLPASTPAVDAFLNSSPLPACQHQRCPRFFLRHPATTLPRGGTADATGEPERLALDSEVILEPRGCITLTPDLRCDLMAMAASQRRAGFAYVGPR